MPKREVRITIGKILQDTFKGLGIYVGQEPILIQWATSEYGVSKRKIDTIAGFISSFEDGDYHIQLDDVSIEIPGFEQFRVVSMDIETTLKNGTWTDLKIFSDEEEVSMEEYANPQKLQDRLSSVIEIVRKMLSFLLLIWQALKVIKGSYSS